MLKCLRTGSESKGIQKSMVIDSELQILLLNQLEQHHQRAAAYIMTLDLLLITVFMSIVSDRAILYMLHDC